VQLTVTDTGTGMTKETITHIFEPFFTTKEKSKGTGLGLSTVYGIVKQSGGYIWVSSEPGKGTSFKILLPQDESTTPLFSTKTHSTSPAAGSGTILVVEDEDSLRELIAELLGRNGYRVLIASDGAQALQVARAFRGPLHLLLADVVLRGIGGPMLAKQLETERPGIRTLYMSGYSDFNTFGGGSLPAEARLLHKPFTKEILLSEVADALTRTETEIPA